MIAKVVLLQQQKLLGGKKMQISNKKVELAMAKKCLTITQAAEQAGISRQRFSIILNQKNVTPRTAGNIARGIGVDVTEILED